MQGTVWSGLICTNTMDKLCQEIHKKDSLPYKYRGVVKVPPLEMIDDIITVSKCGESSIALNNAVNNFVMREKKLKLSVKKCSNIHIGNKASKKSCPMKMVGNEVIKETDKEKYLGDYLTSKANSKDKIMARKAQGYGIL